MRARVVVLNVQGLRAGVDRVGRGLRDLEPDLLLLQECGPRRGLRRLADELGAEVRSSHRPFGRVRNAVLAGRRWHIGEPTSLALSREGRSSPRGALAVALRKDGLALTAVSAHLGLVPAERARHARELTDAFASLGGPVLLGVDVNEGPADPAFRWIAERWFDAFAVAGDGPGETFPSTRPTARIDALFANDRVEVRRAWVGPGGLSDHRPLVADVELLEA
jgi:endonuclease/exonuclease/phosphatase family metal-dependent hydrolase